MCVCLTINARKKFRIKNLHTLPNKTDGYAAMFLLQCGGRHFCWCHDLPEPQKVVSAGPWKHPKPPHSVLAPESTLTRVNSSRVNSHSPVSTRPLCQLVAESTRPRINSSPGQLESRSTRPRVNSSPSQLASGQLVPAYHTTHLPIYLHYLPPT